MHPDPLPPLPAPFLRPVSAQRLGWTALGVCLLLFLTLGAGIQLLDAGVGIWVSEIFLFLGTGWALTRWSGRDPASYVGLRNPNAWTIGFAFALALANYVAFVIPLQTLSTAMAPEWMRRAFDEAQLFERRGPVELGLVIAGAVLVAPLCEEFVFRGLFQQGLQAGGARTTEAAIRAGLVFSVFHLDPLGFLARWELGILFGLLYWRTRSLWAPMAAHFGNNLVGTVLYLVGRDQPQTNTAQLPPLTTLVGIAGMGAVAFVALLLAARSHPRVWGTVEAETSEASRVPIRRAIRPWALAAATVFALWVALDARGIQLGWADLMIPLPSPERNESSTRRAAREQLEALRQKAHSGHASLEQYRRRRRALASPPTEVPIRL